MKRLLVQLLIVSCIYTHIHGQDNSPTNSLITHVSQQSQSNKVTPFLMSILAALFIYKYYTYNAAQQAQIGNPLFVDNNNRNRLMRILFPIENDIHPLALDPMDNEMNRLINFLFFTDDEAHPFALAPEHAQPQE